MEAGLASEGSSGSELGLVEAAKAQRRARPPPRPSPPAAATATACTADSDSDDGEPFVLAAAKKQASKAGSPSRHPRAASATAGTASPLAVKPAAQPGGLQSDSDSELDLVALAKQRSRMAHPADAAAAHGSSPARSPGAAHAASPTKPAGRRAAPAPAACEGPGPLPAPVQGGGSPLQGADEGEAEGQRAPAGGGTARRRLQKSISLAPERDQPEEQASPTAGALAEAAAPSQCSRMSTVVEHGGEPQGSALLELAAGPLPVLMEDGSPPPSQAFAFTPPHSPSRPRSRQPSGAGVAGPAAASPSRAASQGRGASGGAGAAAGSPAVPLASLADLGDVMSAAVGESSLRADIGRLEAGWQARWQEQADSTAEVRGRLEGLQAATASSAHEVAGRLQALQGELAQQSLRLEAVERLHGWQVDQEQVEQRQQAAPHASSAAGAAATSSPPPAAAEGDAPSVEAILGRLTALEDRVGAHLQSIEAARAAAGSALSAGHRSAPVSPLRCGTWTVEEHAERSTYSPPPRSPSRAAQAAAVATAAVYGTTTDSEACCLVGRSGKVAYGARHSTWEYAAEASSPRSPRIQAGGPACPASAGPEYRLAGGSPHSRRSRAEVDAQVAETHAVVAGIQASIAAIKSSLACASTELGARRAQAGLAAQRLEALERAELDRRARQQAQAEASSPASTPALERRVRGLEAQLEAATRDAAAGRAEARSARVAVAALDWRVTQSTDATLGTIQALEARQSRVAATAGLADAKAAALSAEVARLQRRLHCGSPLGSPSGRSAFRLY